MAQYKVIDFDIIRQVMNQCRRKLCQPLQVPWAKRIHGVEGSDAAHKACAEISQDKRSHILW